jgi:hypothetical protein
MSPAVSNGGMGTCAQLVNVREWMVAQRGYMTLCIAAHDSAARDATASRVDGSTRHRCVTAARGYVAAVAHLAEYRYGLQWSASIALSGVHG